MNYAYNALFDFIPASTTRDGKAVLFKAETRSDFETKQRNFYAAMAFIKKYPTQSNTVLQKDLGVSIEGCVHTTSYSNLVLSCRSHQFFRFPTAFVGMESHRNVVRAYHIRN